MVTIDSSLFAIHVYDVGRIICFEYDKWADGPALELLLLLVARRIDVVTDADTFVTRINVRVEVTRIALLGILKGLHDGRNLLSYLGHELTLAR